MADGVFTNDIPRDKNDRPLIYPPPPKGKTHADVVDQYRAKNKQPPSYRRTTRFISVLEDEFDLIQWRKRMVALGMGQRNDLVVAASSLTAEKSDKEALDAITSKAMEHAGSSKKATMGTALHKLCERLDLGQPIGSVPAEFEADLKAYEQVRERYNIEYAQIEDMRVYDHWKVAGTPDRVAIIDGKCVIADIKTGSIDFANTQREIAMQLAMYAHSTPYRHDTGRFSDPWPVDCARAIVIHLPAGAGRCELRWVDIQAGWEGCHHARAVWEWRLRKSLFAKYDDPPINGLEAAGRSLNIYESALACSTKEQLRELWARVGAMPGGIDEMFKAAVQQRLAQLEPATP